ncbi:hypothetical protein [Pseudophaeobacter sp.]|uniref:hypothetical protein n=1 Tax=Pseudophaeobacter sp. TaxID=1971739 RepID=UPI003297069F
MVEFNEHLLDTSISLTNITLKTIQFFIVVSAAIGGWMISMEPLVETAPLSIERWAWAALYVCVAGPCWLAIVICGFRTNAALEATRISFSEPLKGGDAMEKLTSPLRMELISFGLPLFVLLVVFLILFFP